MIFTLPPQGEEGVAEVIKLLRDEFKTAMMLSGGWGFLVSMNSVIDCSLSSTSGCGKASEISRSLVLHKP